MNRQLAITLLALALCGAWGPAHATESALHNDMDGDGRSDLIWRNASTGAIVFWSRASATSPGTVRVDRLSYNTPQSFDLRRMSVVLTYSDAFFYPTRSVLLVRDPLTGWDFDLFPYQANTNYVAYMSVGNADWKAAGAGDFDGNGTSDLLYRNQRDGRNFLVADAAWADWAGIYPVATVANLAWRVAGVGDFDGDTRSDILWRNSSTGQNAIWRSSNVTTQLRAATVSHLDWKVVAVGDFNGDRRSDILWRNSRTGANVIWKSGSSLMSQAGIGVTNLAWKVVATGDFNGDGKWDLVWRNSATGANVIWKSANAATPQALPTVALAWSAVM